ncbi:MAG: substrate-binding domain-containing protein, partial [Mucilaginibacter polytrichastri]|nr:substrate-binding domain-containing protein [Mucilaginibacter polytrichastri]
TRRVVNIAVLIPAVSPETDYWSYPLNGIKKAAAELKQFGLRVKPHLYNPDEKETFIRAAREMLEQAPQGVLMAPSFVEESIALSAEIRRQEIPLVFINSDLPDQDNLSYIGPDLFQSGRLAAQLAGMRVQEDDRILVLNISGELENDHHLLRKEQGFRSFFTDSGSSITVQTLHIRETSPAAVEKAIAAAMEAGEPVRAVFVTNSRVNVVAAILKKRKRTGISLIGYDFLKKNIRHLGSGDIDFLICQRPQEQGYLGIMALYRHLFRTGTNEPKVYMPIDIITKENYAYYKG